MKVIKTLVVIPSILVLFSLIGCAPTVIIESPADGAQFDVGEEITFIGSAVDLEDGDLTQDSLVWTSDIDGEIGTGETLTIDNLSEGLHTITLTFTGSDGEEEETSITITIGSTSDDDDSDDDDDAADADFCEELCLYGDGFCDDRGFVYGAEIEYMQCDKTDPDCGGTDNVSTDDNCKEKAFYGSCNYISVDATCTVHTVTLKDGLLQYIVA